MWEHGDVGTAHPSTSLPSLALVMMMAGGECGLRKPLSIWEYRPADSTALQLQALMEPCPGCKPIPEGCPLVYCSWTLKLRHLSAAGFPPLGGGCTSFAQPQLPQPSLQYVLPVLDRVPFHTKTICHEVKRCRQL